MSNINIQEDIAGQYLQICIDKENEQEDDSDWLYDEKKDNELEERLS